MVSQKKRVGEEDSGIGNILRSSVSAEDVASTKLGTSIPPSLASNELEHQSIGA
jgi:hypothetical protein